MAKNKAQAKRLRKILKLLDKTIEEAQEDDKEYAAGQLAAAYNIINMVHYNFEDPLNIRPALSKMINAETDDR